MALPDKSSWSNAAASSEIFKAEQLQARYEASDVDLPDLAGQVLERGPTSTLLAANASRRMSSLPAALASSL